MQLTIGGTESNHDWCTADNPPASRAEVMCPTVPCAFMVWCLIKHREGLTCTLISMAQQPTVGEGVLIVEVSRSHSDTPHSVGLLWTGNQPDAVTDYTQHPQESDIHASGGIRTHNPSKRAATDPSLRPCGNWNRHL